MRTPGDGKGSLMQLPDRPNLRHLRDQAKDLVRSGAITKAGRRQLAKEEDHWKAISVAVSRVLEGA
jgi:hypothetical protein